MLEIIREATEFSSRHTTQVLDSGREHQVVEEEKGEEKKEDEEVGDSPVDSSDEYDTDLEIEGMFCRHLV